MISAVSITGDIAPSLSDRMTRYHVPAVSLALIEEGRITDTVFIDTTDESPFHFIGTDTQFQAASISKAVTAIGIMRLVDQGLLELDGSANSYLSRFILKENDGAPAEAVTLRQLLSHSGGVNMTSYPGFERNADLPDLLEILEGADKAESLPVRVTHAAGSYRYSGGGFLILQAIIEDVSGESFGVFMQREIFTPLAMSNTSFKIADADRWHISGHRWNGSPVDGGWADYPQAAAAGLWSTPTDLARLLVALGAAWRGDDETLLSQNAARDMATPQGGGMGLGFGLNGEDAALLLSHSGANIGFNTFVLLYPQTGNGAVIMTNGDGGRYLYDDILRTLEQARDWPSRMTAKTFDPDPDETDRVSALAGTYRMNPPGFIVKISCDADRSACDLITPRESRYRIRATSDTGFHLGETGDELGVSDDGTIHVWSMTGVPVPGL